MPNDPVLARSEMQRLTASRRTSWDPEWFVFGEHALSPLDVVSRLRGFMTDERAQRIEDVLDARTLSLAVVVEGMVDTGNIAAVMRTAEGFGVQTFHTVDTARSYKHSKRTSQGAEKWLDRWRWHSAGECVSHLRDDGFRLIAAHLGADAVPVDEVDFSMPTAVVLGNELAGLSGEMLSLVDQKAMIPIDGFVQSFNISVAAALFLAQARRDRVTRLGEHGDLSDEHRDRLRAIWYLKSVPNARLLMQRLLDDEAEF